MGLSRLPLPVAHGLALLAAFAALAWGIGERALFESSEARYGSLAAEMVRSGDWLVPRLNGVRRFEKPPLAMWCMAASVSVLGESELALRLPGVLAALAAVLAAAKLAGDAAGARLLAGALLLASPLHLACAKALTTDIYLAAFAAGALAMLADGIEHPERRRATLVGASALVGLGFLTKGPAILLFTLIPAAGEILWSRGPREIRSLLSPSAAGVFAAIAAPWFVIVSLKEEGLAAWFLRQRAVGALVSAREFHAGPLFYFLPVLLLGFLPGSILAAGRYGEVGRPGSLPRVDRLLLLAVVVPLLVFSLSASKLATYVLPSGAAIAALAARREPRRTPVLAAAGLVATAAVGFVLLRHEIPWLQNPSHPVPPDAVWWLAAAAVLMALGGLGATGAALAGHPRAAVASMVLGLVLGLDTASLAVTRAQDVLGSGRPLIQEAASLAGPNGPIICYRSFLRGIPFYARRNAILVKWYKPKKMHVEEWDAVGVAADDRMRTMLRAGPAAVICERKWIPELRREVPELRFVRDDGYYALLAIPAQPPALPAQVP